MNLSEYFSIISDIFSSSGLQIGPVKIQCKDSTNIQILKKKDSVTILFSKNKPVVQIKKIITFSVNVSGVHLSKNGGVLELENFPDFPFTYDQFSK